MSRVCCLSAALFVILLFGMESYAQAQGMVLVCDDPVCRVMPTLFNGGSCCRMVPRGGTEYRTLSFGFNDLHSAVKSPPCDSIALDRAVKASSKDRGTRISFEMKDATMIRPKMEVALSSTADLHQALQQCDDIALTNSVNAFLTAQNYANPFPATQSYDPFPAQKAYDPFPPPPPQSPLPKGSGTSQRPQIALAQSTPTGVQPCAQAIDSRDYSVSTSSENPPFCGPKVEVRVSNRSGQRLRCTAYIRLESGIDSGSTGDVSPSGQNQFVGSHCNAIVPPTADVACFIVDTENSCSATYKR